MLSAMARGSMTFGAKEALRSLMSLRDSKIILIPINPKRMKVSQWSILVMKPLNWLPNTKPKRGMMACAPPNQSPVIIKCFGWAFCTLSPLQMAMAKASIETPTAMISNSNKDMSVLLFN